MTLLGAILIGLAALPLAMSLINIALLVCSLRRDRRRTPPPGALLSILVPARDEEANIEACVTAALTTEGVPFEVLVMDDSSRDRTAEIVERMASAEARVRLLRAPSLPPGWSGKAHALQRLAEAARGTHLLFVDADVRLRRDAARTLLGRLGNAGAGLVSGVPAQRLPNWGTRLTVPTINLLLLGYYPLFFARLFRAPGFAAGCGQMMLVERNAYQSVDGHAPIRQSLHDGLTLPRLFRKRGFKTDLTAGWPLAECRMYEDLPQAWHGFGKNAREGMAKAVALPIWTLLLAGAHIAPPLAMLGALSAGAMPLAIEAAIAWGLALAFRCVTALTVREGWSSVVLTPAIVSIALAIQWCALIRNPRRGGAQWRGRRYDLNASEP